MKVRMIKQSVHCECGKAWVEMSNGVRITSTLHNLFRLSSPIEPERRRAWGVQEEKKAVASK